MTFKQGWEMFTRPIEPLLLALTEFLSALWASLLANGPVALVRTGPARDLAIAKWYRVTEPHFFRFESTGPVPNLVASASGTVIELGPGTGNQLSRFDPSKIDIVYGLEPNPNFVPDIKRKVAQADLQAKYELITAGAEDAAAVLRDRGIAEGTVDTVLSIQVLCSVDDPKPVVKEMYRLLKPGGRLIFWEHGRSAHWVSAVAQTCWNWIWRPLMRGCTITRDIKSVLKDAGEWENFDSIQADMTPYNILPRSSGILIKKA